MRTSVLFASLAALCLAACEPGSLRWRQARASPAPSEALSEAPRGESRDETRSTLTAAVAAEDLAPAEPGESLALTHEPHLAPVDHLGRARALRQAGDLSGALTEARRAVHDAGEDLDARETALDHLIPLARLSGQKALAVEAYEELAHLFPDGPEPLVQKARVLLDVGDLEGAVRAAEAAPEH